MNSLIKLNKKHNESWKTRKGKLLLYVRKRPFSLIVNRNQQT